MQSGKVIINEESGVDGNFGCYPILVPDPCHAGSDNTEQPIGKLYIWCFERPKKKGGRDQYLGYSEPFHQGNSPDPCAGEPGRVMGGGAGGGALGEAGSLGLGRNIGQRYG